MAYNPGISYQGGAGLARGMETAGRALGAGLQRRREAKERKEVTDVFRKYLEVNPEVMRRLGIDDLGDLSPNQIEGLSDVLDLDAQVGMQRRQELQMEQAQQQIQMDELRMRDMERRLEADVREREALEETYSVPPPPPPSGGMEGVTELGGPPPRVAAARGVGPPMPPSGGLAPRLPGAPALRSPEGPGLPLPRSLGGVPAAVPPPGELYVPSGASPQDLSKDYIAAGGRNPETWARLRGGTGPKTYTSPTGVTYTWLDKGTLSRDRLPSEQSDERAKANKAARGEIAKLKGEMETMDIQLRTKQLPRVKLETEEDLALAQRQLRGLMRQYKELFGEDYNDTQPKGAEAAAEKAPDFSKMTDEQFWWDL